MDLRVAITTQNNVSFTLAKHVLPTAASNSVFSPLSINLVLGLVTAGSRGHTADQLLSFLRSKSTDDVNALCSHIADVVLVDGSPNGGPRLSFANGVWIDQTLRLRHSFKQVADGVFRAGTSEVDFQNKAVEASNKVNRWAERETGGLIKDILPPGSVDRSTRLIFANALYYKGAWDQKFEEVNTKEREFHLLNGSSVQVPFMNSKKKQYIRSFDGFKVLGLPYKQGEDKRRFTMYLFLPDAMDGLAALLEKVSSEAGFLERHLPYEKVKVGDFCIPKFKVSFGFEVSEVLKRLGVESPFNGEGLTEIVDSPAGGNLCVSNIFHKSFVEVNEEGTEAAAATAAVMMLTSFRVEEKIDFVADHPFIFLIREDTTGVVLFIGNILNPLAD